MYKLCTVGLVYRLYVACMHTYMYITYMYIYTGYSVPPDGTSEVSTYCPLYPVPGTHSIERTSPSLSSFAAFRCLLLETHGLPSSSDIAITFHDPQTHSAEATPLSSDKSLRRALAAATPLLRLFLYRRSDMEVSSVSTRWLSFQAWTSVGTVSASKLPQAHS